MNLRDLQFLDYEANNFAESLFKDVLNGSVKIRDILGFSLDPKKTRGDLRSDNIPLRAALVLYDEIFVTIPNRDKTVSDVEAHFGFDINDFAQLAEMGRIIVTFNNPYVTYDTKIIEKIVKPGIRHVPLPQLNLIRFLKASQVRYIIEDCSKEIRKDFKNLVSTPICFYTMLAHDFKIPLNKMLKEVPKSEAIKLNKYCLLCFSKYGSYILESYKMNSVPLHDAPYCLHNNESILNNPPSNCIFFESFFQTINNIDSICEGLNILYNDDIELDKYMEIIDGKSTNAVRRIFEKISDNPNYLKSKQQLYSKIYEINEEVKNVSKSKLTKISTNITDILGYKLRNDVPEKSFSKSIEYLKDITIKLQARILQKDWSIIQLSRIRNKLENCLNCEKNSIT